MRAIRTRTAVFEVDARPGAAGRLRRKQYLIPLGSRRLQCAVHVHTAARVDHGARPYQQRLARHDIKATREIDFFISADREIIGHHIVSVAAGSSSIGHAVVTISGQVIPTVTEIDSCVGPIMGQHLVNRIRSIIVDRVAGDYWRPFLLDIDTNPISIITVVAWIIPSAEDLVTADRWGASVHSNAMIFIIPNHVIADHRAAGGNGEARIMMMNI